MNKKTILFIALILAFLAQWFIPLQMIKAKEDVELKGTLHKLKVAPIDPYDPFRGRYLVLNFRNNTVALNDTIGFFPGTQQAYVQFRVDSAGFHVPSTVTVKKPESKNYLTCEVRANQDLNQLWITYPVNRFYLNEDLAPRAESIYFEEIRNEKEAWAEIYIHDGEMVLKDVLIEGKSIKDWASESLQE